MDDKCVLLPHERYFCRGLPIAVLYGGNTKEDYNAESHVLYRRDFWKIFHVDKGHGVLVINGKRHPFKEGFTCLIHPDDLTTFELDSDIQLYNILFFREVLAPWLGDLKRESDFFAIFDEEGPERESVIADQLYLLDANRKIRALVHEMRKEFLREGRNSIMLLRLQLMELLIQMNRQSETLFPKRRRSCLAAHVVAQLERHYDEDFDYRKSAEELAITHVYLCSAYRKEMGEAIGQTLFRIRIRNAKRLLSETRKSIIEISTLCGFNDLSYFYRSFKKDTGLAPGDFRRKFALFH